MKDTVSARYAEALFERSKAQGTLDAVASELEQIGAMVRDHAPLRQLLLNPDVEIADKLAVLERLMGGAWSADIRAFVQVVLTLDRAGHLAEMVDAFQELVDIERRVLRVTVRSARALPPEHRTRLVQWIERQEGVRVALIEEVDPTLIGGLQVSMRNRTFDGSLKTQLGTLRQRLKQVRVH